MRFSSGVVNPGFMNADATHKERKTDLPLIPSLGEGGERHNSPRNLSPVFKGDAFPLVQANGTQGVMVFDKGH
jgi:hypothetical protein